MLRSICNECQDPIACMDACGCFIGDIRSTHGGNVNPEMSGFQTDWSGLKTEDIGIRVSMSDEYLDKNGIDIVN